MDIRKLQRAIVDGLEDVKAQNIQVFNTEQLSPLFERVIVASGQSNRQTKALAASVRDAVKSRGMAVLRTEGEDNGEWIIVDCGAAVAHIMQPPIRDYYRLEEIWGGKPVKIKLSESRGGLVKASEGPADEDEDEDGRGAVRAAPARKAAAKKSAAKKAPAKKTPAKKAAPAGKAAARKAVPAKAPAKKAAPARAPARKAGGARGASPSAAPAGRGAGARGTGAGAKSTHAGANAAGMRKVVVPASSSRGAASKKAAPHGAAAKRAAPHGAAAKKAAPRGAAKKPNARRG
jgi:ribosome-associated protein